MGRRLPTWLQMEGPEGDRGVNYRALNELFAVCCAMAFPAGSLLSGLRVLSRHAMRFGAQHGTARHGSAFRNGIAFHSELCPTGSTRLSVRSPAAAVDGRHAVRSVRRYAKRARRSMTARSSSRWFGARRSPSALLYSAIPRGSATDRSLVAALSPQCRVLRDRCTVFCGAGRGVQ